MKDYVWQFYNEGLATTFYLKPLKFIEKYIKNKILFKIIKTLLIVFYTLFVIIVAWFIFWDRYPL